MSGKLPLNRVNKLAKTQLLPILSFGQGDFLPQF